MAKQPTGRSRQGRASGVDRRARTPTAPLAGNRVRRCARRRVADERRRRAARRWAPERVARRDRVERLRCPRSCDGAGTAVPSRRARRARRGPRRRPPPERRRAQPSCSRRSKPRARRSSSPRAAAARRSASALQPRALGDVRIHLSQTADGLLARVTADTQGAAQVLAAGRAELHQSLSSLGVSLLRLDIGSFGHAQARGGEGSEAREGQARGRPRATPPATARTRRTRKRTSWCRWSGAVKRRAGGRARMTHAKGKNR